MDPLDPLKKIVEDTRVVETPDRVVLSFSKSLLFWWLLALSGGAVAIAYLGGMQVDAITRVLSSIDAKLTPLLDWQRSADTTIRYNTRRLDTFETSLTGEKAVRLPIPPPDCKDVRPGEPCQLR